MKKLLSMLLIAIMTLGVVPVSAAPITSNKIKIGDFHYKLEDIAYDITDKSGNIIENGLLSDWMQDQQTSVSPRLNFDVAGKVLQNGEVMSFYPAGSNGFLITGGTIVEFNLGFKYIEENPAPRSRLYYSFNDQSKITINESTSYNRGITFIPENYGYYKFHIINLSSDPITFARFSVVF